MTVASAAKSKLAMTRSGGETLNPENATYHRG
jgi:hypothetical protein